MSNQYIYKTDSNGNKILIMDPSITHPYMLNNNTTEYQTCPQNVFAHEAFTIPLCESAQVVQIITDTLSTINHIHFEYIRQLKGWTFMVGYEPRFSRQHISKLMRYRIALEAFKKTPKNFDNDEDRLRRIQYTYYLENYDEYEEEELLPFCKGSVSLFYDPSKKNIVVEFHRTVSEDGGDLTSRIILEKVRSALLSAGFEVAPYEEKIRALKLYNYAKKKI